MWLEEWAGKEWSGFAGTHSPMGLLPASPRTPRMAIWWDRRDGHLFPISQLTKCNAHGFPKGMQIWRSRTTHAQGAATVDGRVLSPCWPHEYAERVFWESSQFSNNKPALQLYLNLIRKGPWQIFLLGLSELYLIKSWSQWVSTTTSY